MRAALDAVKSRISVKAQVMRRDLSVRQALEKSASMPTRLKVVLISMDAYGIPFCISGRTPPTAFAVDNHETVGPLLNFVCGRVSCKSVTTPESCHLSRCEGERRSAEAKPEGGSDEEASESH